MPVAPSPAQQAASRNNAAASHGPVTEAGKVRAARNGTRHGLRGGEFAIQPGEDAEELDLLRRAVTADWRPRDAYERHWTAELVAAMWRQQRLRRLEFAALEAAGQEHPPSEASLKRLLTFARYGARLDGDLGRALKALGSLKGRTAADLADETECTREPEPAPVAAKPVPVETTAASTRTPEPERATAPARLAQTRLAAPTPSATAEPLNRHARRRLEALARAAQRRAA